MPGAESTMLKGGAGRRIERWFYELGTEGGLVDVPGLRRGTARARLRRLGRRRERPRRQPGGAGHAQQLVPAARARDREADRPSAPSSGRYMDHWRSNGPAGPVDQWHSRKTMSAFLKQIKATGFDAIDTFDFRIWQMYGDYGGPAKYQEMVQDHGLERIVNTFHAADYDVRNYAPHISRDAREHLRGLPRHDGPLVGDPARQHHRDAGDALLRHGAGHRGQAQVHRGVLEQGRRDHRRLRGEAHLPPRVLLRHPERARHRDLLQLHRPAVRLAVRRHRAALHRRARPGGAVQPARAPGERVPLQGHPERGHRRRPPPPPRLRDHGADHRQVVLRDGHAATAWSTSRR